MSWKGRFSKLTMGLPSSFKFQELPNDMKMLAMLAGELTISAKYFSPFANVCKDDCTDLRGTFGVDAKNKWQPWNFENRRSVVKQLEIFKKTIENKEISEKSKRSKVTDFIARNKSRQEFLPLVGKVIDKAHVESLHLKNNAWQYFFKGILKEAIRKSKVPDNCKKFTEIPNDSIFARIINALQMEVKAKSLSRKVKHWFDEIQGSTHDLQYRFTGKDSRKFCHNFMTLIKWLSH